MPAASSGFVPQIVINYTLGGRDVRLLHQRKLSGPDAMAKAAVIDKITDVVLAQWADIVDPDQIREAVDDFVREICKAKE